MIAETLKIQEESKFNPKKFVVWLFVIAIIMFFAGLTSAYIVRKAEGNWFNFNLPIQFTYSTITIVMSSFTLWLTKKSLLNENLRNIKVFLFLTISFGLLFCIFQYLGWKNMNLQNLYFSDDANGDKISASFIYVLSGLHVLHVLAGLIFLLVVFIKSLSNKITINNNLSLQTCSIYWHFIGIVWIYLFIFFNIT
ncbi:MAG: cytochrome c oxidase subunit 3 [Bacteroidia bacterium]|nr:cytochrome c oxidase subunit 3 [Bacteroidia bacterium]